MLYSDLKEIEDGMELIHNTYSGKKKVYVYGTIFENSEFRAAVVSESSQVPRSRFSEFAVMKDSEAYDHLDLAQAQYSCWEDKTARVVLEGDDAVDYYIITAVDFHNLQFVSHE